MAELEKEVVVEEKVEEKKADKKPAKAKKDKKPRENKLGRKFKETTSELKKVSWISFGEICKRTGIVLGFVLLSALILLGIDKLLSLIYDLLVSNIGV